MRRFSLILLLTLTWCALICAQSLTTVILPQYIEGINGTNANRIPFAYRVRLTGLLANATYRFSNQIVTSADGATTNGAGNCIFVSATGNFVRTSSPSLATAGGYGTFTTDVTGAYEGWFANEPTGNARFVPGKFVFMRIALNDGGSGTTVALRLTTPDSVRVVKLDPAASDSTGTGLRCTSAASPRDFVFVYDNTAGTGRPISGSFVESDGTDNSLANSYAAFYANSVNAVDGAFGIVLPNALPNGIRRIERRSLATGAVVDSATDADGVWPSGATTVNPSGGTTEIILAGTDARLPIQLAAFTGAIMDNNAVRLDWMTLSEVDDYGFTVLRRLSTQQNFTELPNSFVPGHGTTLIPQHYTHTDNTAGAGRWFYRLKQIDLDGTTTMSDAIYVDVVTGVKGTALTAFMLNQNFPNPFNPTTTINFSVGETGCATLSIYNLLGQLVGTAFKEQVTPGREYAVTFDGTQLPSGLYFYRLTSGGRAATKALVLMK